MVWELKPISYLNDQSKYNTAIAKLNDYIRVANANDQINKNWKPGNSMLLLDGKNEVWGGFLEVGGGTYEVTFYADTKNPDSGLIFYTTKEIKTPSESFLESLRNAFEQSTSQSSGPLPYSRPPIIIWP